MRSLYPVQGSLPYIVVTDQRSYPIRQAPTSEPLTFLDFADDEVISLLSLLVPLFYLIITAFQLLFFQVIRVSVGDLRSLCSWAWDNYVFLTHVTRDLLAHDISYRRLLGSRGSASSLGRSDSLPSTPSIE